MSMDSWSAYAVVYCFAVLRPSRRLPVEWSCIAADSRHRYVSCKYKNALLVLDHAHSVCQYACVHMCVCACIRVCCGGGYVRVCVFVFVSEPERGKLILCQYLRLRLVGHIPKWESLGITRNHSRPFGWSKKCVRLVTFHMIPEWESLRMILFGE